jgi:hypothetical protein
MYRILLFLSLTLTLAQSIAAFAVYPYLPQQIRTVDLYGPVTALVYGERPVGVSIEVEKAGILVIPAGGLAFQAIYWFFLSRSHSFMPVLFTGVTGYGQSMVVWCVHNGPNDLIHSIIAVAWWGLIALSLAIVTLRGDCRPRQTVLTLANERIWVDDHRTVAWLLAVAALIAFVFCMTTGSPFLFTAAFAVAIVISVGLPNFQARPPAKTSLS